MNTISLSLNDIKAYARKNRNKVYDIANATECLVCDMMKTLHRKPIRFGSTERFVITQDRHEDVGTVPTEYASMCEGDSDIKLFTGSQIERAIRRIQKGEVARTVVDSMKPKTSRK